MLEFAPMQLSDTWRTNLFGSAEQCFGITECQLYAPHHERFFNLDNDNRNTVTIAPAQHTVRFSSPDTAEVDVSEDQDGSATTTVPVHVKFCPLVDALDYLVNASGAADQSLALPASTHPIPPQLAEARANNIHNRAYTDAFFVYLSSRLRNNYQFLNALNYYGLFTGIRRNHRINIVNDLDELWESESFMGGLDNRFTMDAEPMKDAFRAIQEQLQHEHSDPDETPKAPLSIQPLSTLPSTDAFDVEELTTLPAPAPAHTSTPAHTFTHLHSSPLAEELEPYEFPSYDAVDRLKQTTLEDDDDEDGDSNRTSVTDPEELAHQRKLRLRKKRNAREEKGDRSGSVSSSDSDDDEASDSLGSGVEGGSEGSESDSDGSDAGSGVEEPPVWCTVPQIAVAAIVQERMESTLEELFEDPDVIFEEAQWRSCLFQIIAALHAYNTAYDMVHNDLHAGNIMAIPTRMQHLVYRHRGKVYKVPTYGRIFKIIDFGRATYRFGGLVFLNDCFDPDNDAANQYNWDRLHDPSQPPCFPHPSFDLCRLACGLYDYFDAEGEYSDDPDGTPNSGAAAMVARWCEDDEGRNMLYKKTGEERYPGFKLYRMIARKVTRHVPAEVLEDSWFVGYRLHPKKARKLLGNVDTMMDLDAIKPEYYVKE